MKWLGNIFNSKFRGSLYLAIWYGIIDTILLIVKRRIRFWRLLILILGIQTIKKHEVYLHCHFLLVWSWFAIEFNSTLAL